MFFSEQRISSPLNIIGIGIELVGSIIFLYPSPMSFSHGISFGHDFDSDPDFDSDIWWAKPTLRWLVTFHYFFEMNKVCKKEKQKKVR